jgi:hypothetical protein
MSLAIRNFLKLDFHKYFLIKIVYFVEYEK